MKKIRVLSSSLDKSGQKPVSIELIQRLILGDEEGIHKILIRKTRYASLWRVTLQLPSVLEEA